MAPLNVSMNSEQLAAYNDMIDFSVSSGFGEMVFTGYAGTGKTFTISKVVEELQRRGVKVAMMAPTNKAVKVLKEYCPGDMIFTTVHSFLKLKPVYDDNGLLSFIPDSNPLLKDASSRIKVYVVDEVSMLNDGIYHDLRNKAMENDARVIYVGDPCQVPPVRMKKLASAAIDALPLDADHQKKNAIATASLTQIMRQSNGSNIIDVASDVRNRIGSFDGKINISGSNMDAWWVPRFDDGSHDKSFVKELMQAWFLCDDFEKDSSHSKVIAWTNKKVEAYNAAIRKMMYGDSVSFITEGDRLIADAPWLLEKPHINTSDEMRVKSLKVKRSQVVGDVKKRELMYYDCEVLNEDENTTRKVRIIHEDSKGDYDDIVAEALSVAKKRKTQQHWRVYFNILESFLKVKHEYSLKVHNAQGSTFANVLVDVKDIMLNRNAVERDRILYTALTRASKKLALI